MGFGPEGIANPRREELLRALTRVQLHAVQLETALDPAHASLTGKAVWAGPTARAFAEELTGRRNRLRTLVQRIVEDLEAELRATPEKVDRSSNVR
ncbi:hypothetical protein [Streptosporangium roseum]|uniref:Uncharacterized protein n=1 Tax=Streptosporangium roseum (strain ATCC 12428 / DSM 43021 / JCM 3005 / KCTC 9067 / NCIMB 10171 / NRRL 2505 / NI 9100) TaxID=479432 RepID=D2AYR8_STRRD|nr:hypothetical protein [Streptosporangium roseum]ACZ89051.1 hypothetical protein Sros_6330 [Streptosporangium roseum DSM 43021]